jgi:hypothetical protein
MTPLRETQYDILEVTSKPQAVNEKQNSQRALSYLKTLRHRPSPGRGRNAE